MFSRPLRGDMATIAILGTGSVGEALGNGWAGTHEIVFGSRAPDDVESGGRIDPDPAVVTTQADAARRGDVVVLAVPGSAAADVAGTLADDLAGTPVLDCTNEYPDRTSEGAIAERVKAAAPGAIVAKAFNTIGANRMVEPAFDGGTASMFVCGEPEAVGVASDLAEALGFDVVEAGDLSAAIYLEDLARLWIHLSRVHGRDIGFRLLGTV